MLCGHAVRAKLAGQLADLLLVGSALTVPLMAGLQQLLLLGVESQFALDERRGLLLDLGLAH